MKASLLCFLVIFLVFASAQYRPLFRPPRPQRPSLCAWPEDYRVWTLKCMYGRVEREVKQLMNFILKKQRWSVEELSRALCNPYEVFKLRLYFKKRADQKLLREATVEADKCLRYLLKNTNNA
ncbi:uncharacterized protein LOC119436222 [Dermacentor silvarum]|uniref:uncharacterized protein LOC119436222 n=1 Tax=Dermacentor silvarum TaxID=543639 RepID=UPI00189A51BA|nr:uncharacterized protein LOC119436222 [Dermacentor silvarum]